MGRFGRGNLKGRLKNSVFLFSFFFGFFSGTATLMKVTVWLSRSAFSTFHPTAAQGRPFELLHHSAFL
jgi:hypothetical protein